MRQMKRRQPFGALSDQAAHNTRRLVMWNKDEINGKGKKINGRIKDKAGEIIGNPDLEAEGEAERIEGTAQDSFGRTRRKVEEFLESVKDEVEKAEKENA